MTYGVSNGHVTDDVTWPPKVLWGDTVGYPSDSLASCFWLHAYIGGWDRLLNQISVTFTLSLDRDGSYGKPESALQLGNCHFLVVYVSGRIDQLRTNVTLPGAPNARHSDSEQREFTSPASTTEVSAASGRRVRVTVWRHCPGRTPAGGLWGTKNRTQDGARQSCRGGLRPQGGRDVYRVHFSITRWRPLLPHGYSYKASCARPG